MSKPSIRLSIGGGIAPGRTDSLSDQLALLREMEELNLLHLAGGGGADAQSGLYAAMALVAEHTRRTLVGSMVDNPYTRLPTVAAGEISMIQQISGGRAFFCLGTGGGQARATLRQFGLEPTTLAVFREYAAAVKGLCAGVPVEYQGRTLQIWGDREPSNVPLYLDVSGPRGMRLCGEIADGAIIPYGISQEAVAQFKEGIAEGARAVGRDPAAVECWWIPPVMLADTEAEALEKLKFYLAMRTNSIMSYPEKKAVPEELHERIRAFRAEYVPTAHSRPDLKTNSALLDKHDLTEWAASRHAILGPPGRIVERILEVASWGVTNIMFALWDRTVEDRRKSVRIFAEKVLPHVT